MSRDEILAMKPGRELDALVAEKVMGWTVYRGATPNHYDLLEDEFAQGFPPGEDVSGVPFEIEEYSLLISRAWEVVEKMNQTEHWRLQLTQMARGFVRWQATFSGAIRDVGAIHAPEAIVKAALLACLEVDE